MKQTPIPEKIKTEIGCGEVNTPIGIAIKFSEYARIISSLIDVLTEQQKEIEGLKSAFINHTIVDNSVAHKPYTAMRSTGEYCKCKEPHVTDSAGMDIVHCISCGKEPSPIKPQEDIEKFVDYSIKKYKKTYKALGNSQEDIREKIADLYVDSVCDDSKCRIRHMHKAAGLELADRILAIVKGE